VGTDWFEQWFDEDYLLVYSHRDDGDAARGLRLLLDQTRPRPGARVLDLACGTGRHALPLAEQGMRVVGLDLSPVLLARAARRFREAGRHIPLVRGDSRSLPFRACFDVVASFFTSFGYFDDPADDRRALEGMVGCLRSGGALLLDLINPQHLKANLVPESRFERDGLEVLERRELRGDVIVKSITISRAGDRRLVEERVRLYERPTMERWCHQLGLRELRFFGDYAGSPLRSSSPRLILVGHRVG
jgi:SAM-dependent methyltransferase